MEDVVLNENVDLPIELVIFVTTRSVFPPEELLDLRECERGMVYRNVLTVPLARPFCILRERSTACNGDTSPGGFLTSHLIEHVEPGQFDVR